MPNINLRTDTVAVVAPLRRRFGFGHSYDSVITQLVENHNLGRTEAVLLFERVKNLEKIATQNQMMIEEILMLLRGGNGGGTPPSMTVS